MPRYYFHLHDDAFSEDCEGMELSDQAAAREHALECARDIVCHNVKAGYLNLDHRIEVKDGQGNAILNLTFREAFTLDG